MCKLESQQEVPMFASASEDQLRAVAPHVTLRMYNNGTQLHSAEATAWHEVSSPAPLRCSEHSYSKRGLKPSRPAP